MRRQMPGASEQGQAVGAIAGRAGKEGTRAKTKKEAEFLGFVVPFQNKYCNAPFLRLSWVYGIAAPECHNEAGKAVAKLSRNPLGRLSGLRVWRCKATCERRK